MCTVCANTVNTMRYDKREQLLSGPQWFRFEYGRLRNEPIPIVKVHQQIHEVSLKGLNKITKIVLKMLDCYSIDQQ